MFAVFALFVSYQYAFGAAIRSSTAAPEPHGDGHYYYEYLRSLVFDGDLDVTNEHQLMGDPFRTGFSPVTNKGQNVFTIGPALFWLPMVPAAFAVQTISNASSPTQRPIDGTELPFQRTVTFGSVIAGLLAIALSIRLARRVTTRSFAVIAGIGVCLGSPLMWYMLHQSSYSHSVDACAIALFASAWLARYGSRKLGHWVGLGVLLGFSMLVRPQNALQGIFPLCEWLIVAWGLRGAGDRRALLRWFGTALLFAFCTLLIFSPLVLTWHQMLGRWTLTPQGEEFMDWANSRWDGTLFSSRSGLFAWHPLLWLATVGLAVVVCTRRHARELRLFAALALILLLLQSYVNGAARDWDGGWAFGGRRFLYGIVYFVVGLAAVFDLARSYVVRFPVRTAQLGALLTVSLFYFYNRSLMDDYGAFRAPPDAAQSMKPRYEAAAAKTITEGYSMVGNPGSWPANLWFGLRAGTSPARYDIAGATDLTAHELGHWRNFSDDVHAMGGFEEPTDWGGRRCRLARKREAHWVIVLRQSSRVGGIVTLASSHPGTRVRMRSGGKWFFDSQITTAFADYPIEFPSSATKTGIVYIDVEQILPSKDAFVAWEKTILRVVPGS